MKNHQVLLVDADDNHRKMLLKRTKWSNCGYSIVGEAQTGLQGLDLALHLQPEVIITNTHLPQMDGLTMCRSLLEQLPDTQIIFLTDSCEFECARQAVSLGAADFLLKPTPPATLQKTLLQLRHKLAKQQDLAHLRVHYAKTLTQQSNLLDAPLHQLLELVRSGNFAQAKTVFYHLQQEEPHLLALLDQLCTMQVVSEMVDHMSQILPEKDFLTPQTSNEGVFETIWSHLRTLYHKLGRSLRCMQTDSAQTLSARACAYIEQHYMENDISIERLCETLCVSPSYFSIIFKRENGENFVPYLTRVRMEKAAELLRSTDEKTYSIAQRVGFGQANYFSYVFKKYYGLSPSKFREQHI